MDKLTNDAAGPEENTRTRIYFYICICMCSKAGPRRFQTKLTRRTPSETIEIKNKNKSRDIEVMENEITKGIIFSYIPGREFELFKNYNNERESLPKLHTCACISGQKDCSSGEVI